MRTQPASVSSDTLYLLRRLLSNQHTLTGSEFRAELEKIVGEAYQHEAQEPSKAYAWVYVNKYGVDSIPASKDWCATMVSGHGGSMFPLYTAPQPAPAELERLRERISKMGLDVDRAMRGHVNEQSPLGTTRLAAIAALAKPAPAPLSDDTERLNWLLWRLPGDALRYVVGELADTSSGAEFRAAIDAAIAARPQ